MDYSIYFIPTPIGNLEDITLRALNTLKEVDIIACEDTRESKKLLDYYKIDKPLTSYHKFNEITKSQAIIEEVKKGKTYGVITDQGMPGISDPGHILIKKCIKEKVSYTILPGASAIITALVGSGLSNDKFSYYGFIPKKTSEKNIYYQKLIDEDKTSIILDTPHNFENTIKDFKKIFPQRRLALAREISKKFEEYKLMKIEDIKIEELTLKGEFVLILEKGEKKEKSIVDYKEEILNLVNEGKRTKEIVKEIQKKSKLNKNEIYDYVLQISKNNK
ncbi:MAG: 16S rRNA (cytidine(1402)-2'-O)-methyltransferase [Anaerococcus sp.]|nr:16S rRNA (cytidine(1402)-2'-O)-methyltransferase [Anaerococcus sp.]